MTNIASPIDSEAHRADFDHEHGGYRTREQAEWMAEWLQQEGYTVLIEDTDRVRVRLTDPEYWWPESTSHDEWEATLADARQLHQP